MVTSRPSGSFQRGISIVIEQVVDLSLSHLPLEVVQKDDNKKENFLDSLMKARNTSRVLTPH
jgi:hypothetical protein